jgi:sterol-4alpha-carboxylate 3-dehydrogenase (decarboxylating)
MSEKRKVLVTGGNGFIGRNIVKALAEQGHEVHVVDVGHEAFRDDVIFHDVSITDKEALIKVSSGMDSIVHNASLVHTKNNKSEMVWDVNYTGSVNVMEACRANNISRLVYVSSGSVVYEGDDIENGDESLPYGTKHQAPYAASKAKADKEILEFNGTEGVLTCVLRPHVVFGPEDTRFIPAILYKAQHGQLSRAIGDRDKFSDFTYVTNFADAVVLAEEKLVPGSPICGQAYFITNGEPLAFWNFVEQFITKLGHPPITKKVPTWLFYIYASINEFIDTLKGGTLNTEGSLSRYSVKYMATHHYFNCEKAMRDLGWKPKVSVDEGIEITVRDLKDSGFKL